MTAGESFNRTNQKGYDFLALAAYNGATATLPSAYLASGAVPTSTKPSVGLILDRNDPDKPTLLDVQFLVSVSNMTGIGARFLGWKHSVDDAGLVWWWSKPLLDLALDYTSGAKGSTTYNSVAHYHISKVARVGGSASSYEIYSPETDVPGSVELGGVTFDAIGCELVTVQGKAATNPGKIAFLYGKLP